MKRTVMMRVSKAILIVTVGWAAGFLMLGITDMISWGRLSSAADVFEVVSGTAAGAAALAFSKESRERYAVLGTSFAIFSWTLGQLFWFSYSLVTGLELPYPSVGDMGFVGTYVILFSVIDILKQKNIELFKRYNRSYYILALAAVPIVLSVLGREPVKTVVANFILSFSAVWAMFKAAFLWKHKGYRMFSAGVLLLGVTDIFFVSSVVFFPLGVVIITDPLYPVALSMIAWGIMKGECIPDD